jgi:hypothetical protein
MDAPKGDLAILELEAWCWIRVSPTVRSRYVQGKAQRLYRSDSRIAPALKGFSRKSLVPIIDPSLGNTSAAGSATIERKRFPSIMAIEVDLTRCQADEPRRCQFQGEGPCSRSILPALPSWPRGPLSQVTCAGLVTDSLGRPVSRDEAHWSDIEQGYKLIPRVIPLWRVEE